MVLCCAAAEIFRWSSAVCRGLVGRAEIHSASIVIRTSFHRANARNNPHHPYSLNNHA